MKRRKATKTRYKSVKDLLPWSRAEGRSGNMKPGGPMDLYLERFENDSSFRSHHKMTCCECGFRHLFTYEVYTTDFTDGPNKGEMGWWIKVRAYADDETRPKKVIDHKGRKRK